MLRRNVLIFHSGALGDFILSWPLALALGRIYAQSRIIYVTTGEKGALAERALRIDSTDVESGWHHLFSASGEPPANVARMVDGSHAIFSFVAAADSVWAANVKRIAPNAKLFFIDPNPPAGFAEHASQLLLNQLGSDAVVSTAVSQMLKSIQDRGIGTGRPPGGPILIHPGAGAPKKCWPRENFVSLARKLAAPGREVHVLLGEVERESWSAAEQRAFDGVATVIGPGTLVELLAVITRASKFIGNDSGPTHLAGIVGVPTIALFGPTDPTVWKPLGPNVHVLQAGAMEDISLDQVLEALTK